MEFALKRGAPESKGDLLKSLAVSAVQIDSVANVRRPYHVWKDDPELARLVNDFLFEKSQAKR